MSKVAPDKVREFLMEQRDNGFIDVKEGFQDAGARPRNGKTASTTP